MLKTIQKLKMSVYDSELEMQAAELIQNHLGTTLNAAISVTPGSLLSDVRFKPDLEVRVVRGDVQTTLLCEVMRKAEPLLVRKSLSLLRRATDERAGSVPVLIAPYVSPETSQVCREEGAGYLDFSGNGHLEFHGVYWHVEGRPNLFVQKRTLRSLYQPKAERALRVLISHGPRPWRLQALAQEAGISLGQAHNVKEQLRAKEWAIESEQGLILSRPDRLLQAWAQEYRPRVQRRIDFVTLDSLDAFERTLSEFYRAKEIPFALTGLAAAERYAPHAALRRLTAYVGDDPTHFAEALGLTPVERGANVSLMVPADHAVFFGIQTHQGLPLAAPVQVFLDLQDQGRRGREAADHLQDVLILPMWEDE